MSFEDLVLVGAQLSMQTPCARRSAPATESSTWVTELARSPSASPRASSIEYGGLIHFGPDEPILRRFYELRLQIWDAQGDVHIHRGRELRGLMSEAGFGQVEASTTYFELRDRGSRAWIRWAESPDAFAAFAWGRAVGRRPMSPGSY